MPRPERSVRSPAVFLDRDGVLNQARVVDGLPLPPRDVSDLRLIVSATEACDLLRAAGYRLVVVTNQPDVARGTETIDGVNAIHDAIKAKVLIDEFVVCPHDDADDCACRKPRPGMILAAAERLQLDLARSCIIGDRWRDIEAGERAGCATVFIDRGYDERRPDSPDLVVAELIEAIPFLLDRLAATTEGSPSRA